MTRFLLAPTLLALVAAGCQPVGEDGAPAAADVPAHVDAEQPPVTAVLTPEVTPPDDHGLVSVTVGMNLAPTAIRPRVVELYVEHSADLELVETVAGDATTAAGKQAIGQARNASLARLLIFSAGNVDRIEPGTLAVLTFQQHSDGPAEVRLAEGRQVFAPADANVGLVISEPVEVAAATEEAP